jgi:hypothetical protein
VYQKPKSSPIGRTESRDGSFHVTHYGPITDYPLPPMLFRMRFTGLTSSVIRGRVKIWRNIDLTSFICHDDDGRAGSQAFWIENLQGNHVLGECFQSLKRVTLLMK